MNTITPAQLKKLGSKEMLLQSLIGKVTERLALPKHDMPFYRKKQQWIDAGNCVMDFIESGHVTLRKETLFVNGIFKTLNHVQVVGGKDPLISTIRGYNSTPGIVSQKAVRNVRLKQEDKDVLQILSSIRFHRSEFCTFEHVLKAQSLVAVDKSSSEIDWKRKGRMLGYVKDAMNIKATYLDYKYCGRGRMYPVAGVLEGFKPHGKSWETHAYELDARDLTLIGRDVLLKLQEEGFEGISADLRTPQLEKALDTNSTGMTVECDITNSGLLIAGLCFKSVEILSATNGYGLDWMADSHAKNAEAYDITREQAKKIFVCLLHGGSFSSAARLLKTLTGQDYTTEYVVAAAEKAYGPVVHNFSTIAAYGRSIINNYRSECSWDMPDGFRAVHRAYTTHVPMELQLNSRKVKVISPMPMLMDLAGLPVYDAKTPNLPKDPKGKDIVPENKLMGLYADIIHSIDSYVMREVIRSGIQLLAKHDAFLIHPNDVPLLRATLKRIYSEIFAMDLIRNILWQIEVSTGVDAPMLHVGDAVDKMQESNFFMTVE